MNFFPEKKKKKKKTDLTFSKPTTKLMNIVEETITIPFIGFLAVLFAYMFSLFIIGLLVTTQEKIQTCISCSAKFVCDGNNESPLRCDWCIFLLRHGLKECSFGPCNNCEKAIFDQGPPALLKKNKSV